MTTRAALRGDEELAVRLRDAADRLDHQWQIAGVAPAGVEAPDDLRAAADRLDPPQAPPWHPAWDPDHEEET